LKTDVLLIPPVINPFSEDNKSNFIPLGILALASSLHKEGLSVQIYHPKFRLTNKQDYKKVAKDILKFGSGIIGFSTWCITYPASLLIAEQLKKENKQIKIVFGGPQASILATETLKEFPFVDFILAGEADISFPQFINEIINCTHDFSKINGLSFRNNQGKIITNKLNYFIKNLDELPIPAYELIPEANSISLDVGRGCPFHCTYCSTNNFFSKKYRLKSTERIIHEMNTSFKKAKIKAFSLDHDMFTLNKSKVLELCKRLIQQKEENGVKYTWTCSARIDCIDEEMLISMKKAGCESIFFGIETGSNKIQKSIGKNLNISRAYEIADICRNNGINMHASFILGFPDETLKDLEFTLLCIFNLILSGTIAQSSELTLLPGTHLYNKYHSRLRFDGNFSNFSYTFCGAEELQLIINYPKIFSSFYYLPVHTLKRKEMHFLTLLINSSAEFRNTFFLLKDLLQSEIKNLNLLDLFKSEYIKYYQENNDLKLSVSFWIHFLKSYLRKNITRIEYQSIYDVFAYEAFSALLKVKYARWQLVKLSNTSDFIFDNKKIRLNPTWKILTTSYKLNHIIPSENNWKVKTTTLKHGYYKYLLFAQSEQYCSYTAITQKDEILLQNLIEKPVSSFTQNNREQLRGKKMEYWLYKMNKLGIVDFVDI